jgi:hypothetical protein
MKSDRGSAKDLVNTITKEDVAMILGENVCIAHFINNLKYKGWLTHAGCLFDAFRQATFKPDTGRWCLLLTPCHSHSLGLTGAQLFSVIAY